MLIPTQNIVIRPLAYKGLMLFLVNLIQEFVENGTEFRQLPSGRKP